MIRLRISSGLLLATYTRSEPVPEDDGYVTVYATPARETTCSCNLRGVPQACAAFKRSNAYWWPPDNCANCVHDAACHIPGTGPVRD